MAEGTVKWFDATKGYGFIAPADGGKDLFVHATVVQAAGLDDLEPGDRVAFELTADRRTGKTRARAVKLLREDA